MIELLLAFQLTIDDLTAEQQELVRSEVQRRVTQKLNGRKKTFELTQKKKRLFAPMRHSSSAARQGTGRSGKPMNPNLAVSKPKMLRFHSPKQCLCHEGCPHCSCDCNPCNCIFIVPSKSMWNWRW